MKIEEKPPEMNDGSSAGSSALVLLETENSSLRRLVIELLEKNQTLRDQLRAFAGSRNPGISDDRATAHRVDPQAA